MIAPASRAYHDLCGSNRSKGIVVDLNPAEHDVFRKPVPIFRHHALDKDGSSVMHHDG